MSKWRHEFTYLSRYAGSGVLNTIAGFSVIFLLMGVGVSPLIANTAGYLVGLILGFFVSRRYVFRSGGHITSDGMRYLAAFAVCFTLNLIALQFMIGSLHWNAFFAQILSTAIYTTTMYLLSRWLVFNIKKPPSSPDEPRPT